MLASSGIALLRIGLGIELLLWALDKTRTGWLTDGTVLTQILTNQMGQAPGIYGEFLAAVVLPNVQLFARLVTVGEWVTGISLTLGLLTPVGAALGMWLMLNFMGMRGIVGIEASIDRLFFLGCLICLLTAGRSAWAMDSRLDGIWARRRGGVRAQQTLARLYPSRVGPNPLSN